MQKARRHHIAWLRPLVGVRFQVLFTPVFPVLFTFPSQYQFTIGVSGVFSLGGWCRQIQREFLRFPPTQDTANPINNTFTCLSHSTDGFPTPFNFYQYSISQSYNPNHAVTQLVWANPRSLATTCGITIVFFSCGYLDVSVPHVCFTYT